MRNGFASDEGGDGALVHGDALEEVDDGLVGLAHTTGTALAVLGAMLPL